MENMPRPVVVDVFHRHYHDLGFHRFLNRNLSAYRTYLLSCFAFSVAGTLLESAWIVVVFGAAFILPIFVAGLDHLVFIGLSKQRIMDELQSTYSIYDSWEYLCDEVGMKGV